MSSPAGAQPPNRRVIPLNLTYHAEEDATRQPEISILRGRLRRGCGPEQVREAEAYAAIARLELAVEKFPV